jgi:hypothetical protein
VVLAVAYYFEHFHSDSRQIEERQGLDRILSYIRLLFLCATLVVTSQWPKRLEKYLFFAYLLPVLITSNRFYLTEQWFRLLFYSDLLATGPVLLAFSMTVLHRANRRRVAEVPAAESVA